MLLVLGGQRAGVGRDVIFVLGGQRSVVLVDKCRLLAPERLLEARARA